MHLTTREYDTSAHITPVHIGHPSLIESLITQCNFYGIASFEPLERWPDYTGQQGGSTCQRWPDYTGQQGGSTCQRWTCQMIIQVNKVAVHADYTGRSTCQRWPDYTGQQGGSTCQKHRFSVN